MTRLTQREMVTASMPVMACSALTVRFCRGFISARGGHAQHAVLKGAAPTLGMVVVSTEESYTSKCSFVSNEVIKVYKEEKERENNQGRKSPNITCPASSTRFERHTFVNHHQTGRWAKVHADVNGAFNMLRKVFRDFAYHAGLTLKYTLMRLSPDWG